MLNKKISFWLFICSFLVILMVFVGGITRLTGSGLSIADWRPITGIIPPLSETAWQEEFAKYAATPEFQKINFKMDIQGFKSIYLLEYIHRLIGRLVGFVFLIPLIYFYYKKALNTSNALKLLAIFGLGGLQGIFGWIMVRSGLIDVPHVSHYLLALHLSTAFILLGLIFDFALKNYYNYPNLSEIKIPNILKALIALVFIQVIFGAFTAGLKAGLIYNNFPLMGGTLYPEEIKYIKLNDITINPAIVQFIHRILALIIFIITIMLSLKILKSQKLKDKCEKSISSVMFLVTLQIILGILTLVCYVPIYLASIHQVMACFVFVSLILLRFQLKYKVN